MPTVGVDRFETDRAARHDQPYDGDDAGGDERDLGRRRRSPPATARGVPRIGRRLDSTWLDRMDRHFDDLGFNEIRPEDAAERALPAQLLDLVRAGRKQHRRAGRLYARTRSCGRPIIRIRTASSRSAADDPRPDRAAISRGKHQVLAGGAMGFYALQ